MVQICLYFQIHQPIETTNYRIFDIGYTKEYFDEQRNRDLILKASKYCYEPANKLLLNLINKHKNKFNISLSISGITLEMLEKYSPETLKSFQELAKTNQVEFITQTYYNSLSCIYSKAEFKRQIELHQQAIKKYFNQESKIFSNTQLICSNDIANFIENLGFKGIMSQINNDIIGIKSPNFLYKTNTYKSNINLIIKNNKLSDDIEKRFLNTNSDEYLLTAQKYYQNILNQNPNAQIINLFFKYEILGIKYSKDTKIFDFFENLTNNILEDPNNSFITPTQAIKTIKKKEKLDLPLYISLNNHKNLSKYIGNEMQECAIKEIFALEKEVKKTKNKEVIINWRKLTLSDHFYNMSTTDIANNNNKIYGPYDSYIQFMNILNDLIVKIKTLHQKNQIQTQIMKNPKSNIIQDIKLAIKK